MTTGRISPACFCVVALNSLQKAMILTPCWPKAGPTGGAGFAWPAGICNLICPTISFAIDDMPLTQPEKGSRTNHETGLRARLFYFLESLQKRMLPRVIKRALGIQIRKVG